MIKTAMRLGLAVVVMGFFANFLWGGSADQKADVAALIKGGALVVDVRSSGEFSGGHVDGAVNIPYNVIVREIDRYESDKNRRIIVYCRSGARSAAAKRALESTGYVDVINSGSLRAMRRGIQK